MPLMILCISKTSYGTGYINTNAERSCMRRGYIDAILGIHIGSNLLYK